MSRPMASIEELLESSIANNDLHRSAYVPDDQTAWDIAQKTHALRQLEEQLDESARSTIEERIHAQIALQVALLAPCRRIPPEILSSIFVLAVPDKWDELYVGKRTLYLASVCFRWREIALGTPKLWSSLRFDDRVNSFDRHIGALKAELKKTAQAPLQIRIRMNGPEGWSDEAWALLCAESHRFEDLRLTNIPRNAYDGFLGHPFPLLEGLTVHLDDLPESSNSAADLPLRPFLLAPRVSRLHITYLASVRPFKLPKAWTITELSISAGDRNFGGGPLAPCFAAIVACSNTLESLHLGASAGLGELSGCWPSPTTFPCLKELILSGDAILLGHHISVPNLRSLYLFSQIFSDSNAVEVLQHLLDGSMESQLETLNLKYTEPVSLPQLIACLRRLSSLRDLELWSDEFMGRDIIGPLVSEEIIHELTRDDDNPASLTLLPNLSYLRIGFGYVEELMEAKKHCVLKRIYTSRQETRTVDGVALARLEYLSTYGHMGREGFRRWPPVELDESFQGLRLVAA
ncbi:hypothetical protein GGG16DRAFT_118045 [Schizophyllum commune]